IVPRPPEGPAVTAALALVVALAAQDPAPDAPPTPEAIARAVQQLGDDDYHVRERASRWLWAVGAAAAPARRAGRPSTGAQVIARCRDLLDKIPFGIPPDLPPRFVELIAVARTGGPSAWPNVIPDLLDLGPRGLDVVHKLIERVAVTAAQRAAL